MKFAILGIVLASVGPPQEAVAPTRVGLPAVLQGSYAGLKGIVTAVAAKMPEPDYGSKPSAMPEVRTFGQVIAHIAESQFDACARVQSVPNPMHGRRLEQELKSKADLAKALADSFAFCDEAFSATTDENSLQSVRMQLGSRVLELPRVSVLYGVLAHTSEMYGIGTVYLRAKGLVPPGSEPPGRGRGGL